MPVKSSFFACPISEHAERDRSVGGDSWPVAIHWAAPILLGFGFVAFLLWIYSTLINAPAAGMFQDDGVYLATAKALAEGRGYRIISMPTEPPQTKYPIFFPLLLSLVWRLNPAFPDNLVWLRVVPVGAAVAWLTLSWFLLRRLRASRLMASTVVLLVTVSPWVSFLATALLSETLFAALMTGSLLCLTRILQRDGRPYDAWLAGALMGAAALTRAAAVAPATAGVASLVLARQWRLCVHYLVTLVLLVIPWTLWIGVQNAAAVAADAYYAASSYGSWNIVAAYTWPEKTTVLLGNLLYFAVAPGGMWGFGLPVLWALGVGILALALLGRGLWLMRREPAALAAGATLAMASVWVWPPSRFLVPVAPILLWLAHIGLGRRRWLGVAFATLLLVPAMFHLREQKAEVSTRGSTWFVAGYADDWHRTHEILDWITDNASPNAILAGNLDPAYYLYTGRKAVRAFHADPFPLYYGRMDRQVQPLGTVSDFRDRLLTMEVGYLIITPGAGFAEMAHLRELVSQLSAWMPGSLLVVTGSEASGYVAYRVDRSRLSDTH